MNITDKLKFWWKHRNDTYQIRKLANKYIKDCAIDNNVRNTIWEKKYWPKFCNVDTCQEAHELIQKRIEYVKKKK